MKIINILRIYRHDTVGESLFFTILMDYEPYKICYSTNYPFEESVTKSEQLILGDSNDFLMQHNAVIDADSWVQAFFREENILSWRTADEVLPDELVNSDGNNSTIGLIWKSDGLIKEFSYHENTSPDSIAFPEFKKLQNLINHLEGLRKMY